MTATIQRAKNKTVFEDSAIAAIGTRSPSDGRPEKRVKAKYRIGTDC
jgi:hypothetical protein